MNIYDLVADEERDPLASLFRLRSANYNQERLESTGKWGTSMDRSYPYIYAHRLCQLRSHHWLESFVSWGETTTDQAISITI